MTKSDPDYKKMPKFDKNQQIFNQKNLFCLFLIGCDQFLIKICPFLIEVQFDHNFFLKF